MKNSEIIRRAADIIDAAGSDPAADTKGTFPPGALWFQVRSLREWADDLERTETPQECARRMVEP